MTQPAITRGKRQEPPRWGQPQQRTLHTVTINGREALATRNAAFASAFEKGAQARLAGRAKSSNPYPDHRTDRGSVTFSRALARYWREGWDAAHHAVQAQYPDCEAPA